MRILTLLIALWAASGAHAAVTANWQFDDGVPTNTAATLATETNTPTLNATAAKNGTGALPTFSSDRPGARIWASFSGPLLNDTNAASLSFVNAGLPANTNSNDGSCATVNDNDPLLRATNLTVEAFVKVNRRVFYPLVVGKVRGGGNTSWNLDFDNTGKPRVRIDSGVAFTNGAPGFNQSWTSTQSIEDGQWHHLAFTYTHTNRAVDIYIDYVRKGGGTSYSNLIYDAGQLRIGQGAGARAFDGWIDEVRLTDEVLTPAQFMTVTEPSSTRVYLPAEDGAAGATAGTLTNTFYAPLMNGTAVALGGAKPTFSAERPPASTMLISDGQDGPVVNLNAGSLHFVNAGLPADTNSPSGGMVAIPGSTLSSQLTNFTAEAFIRTDRKVNFPRIIGKARALTGGPSWSLGINSAGNLRARCDTQAPTNTVGFNQTFESPAFVYDGQWHHVALTYDDPTKKLTLYADYVKVLEGTTINPLVFDSGDFQVGAGDQAFDGWIDEVRITDRVLAPAEFLYTVPIKGTIISIQ
jgi:hypothetical protein